METTKGQNSPHHPCSPKVRTLKGWGIPCTHSYEPKPERRNSNHRAKHPGAQGVRTRDCHPCRGCDLQRQKAPAARVICPNRSVLRSQGVHFYAWDLIAPISRGPTHRQRRRPHTPTHSASPFPGSTYNYETPDVTSLVVCGRRRLPLHPS